MQYRRLRQPGGCYFFTVVTYERLPLFSDPENVARLRSAFARAKRKLPFSIDAIVVLPDHIHCLWRLPEGDADFSTRWRMIKHDVSIASVGQPAGPHSSKRGKPVWQRRFWEHLIRDEQDWRRHVDYVHYNPVKHAYVARPADWQYSSFSRAVGKGWYDPDWGSSVPDTVRDMDLE